jgi:large subunit ribosomal protein L9
MKVILTSRIKALGNIGEIRTVSDGYGRNYLLPKRLALIYSEKNYKIFEEEKRAIEERDRENKEKAIVVRDKIERQDIILIENAGDNDRLYGSMTVTKLTNFIGKLIGEEKSLKRNNILIREPIKTLGQFKIVFDLHPDVLLEKNIIVARSKEEAEKIRKSELNKKKEIKDSDGVETKEYFASKMSEKSNKKEDNKEKNEEKEKKEEER